MPGMVPDNDIEGHFEILLGHLTSATWNGIWTELAITTHGFETLGLPRSASDRVIWHECQKQQLMLITANRNDDGPDSLAATIRDSNSLESLPVFTLADPDRILDSSTYTEEVVEALLEYLMDLDNARGAGRIWLP
jgi:hypothetical protein